MRELRVDIKNKIATYNARDGVIVCNNDDYKINFTFDAEWAEFEWKTARFIWDNKYIDVLFFGNTVAVPKLSQATTLTVGVFAGEELHTTTPAKIPCLLSVLCESDRAKEADYYEVNGTLEHRLPVLTPEDEGKILQSHEGVYELRAIEELTVNEEIIETKLAEKVAPVEELALKSAEDLAEIDNRVTETESVIELWSQTITGEGEGSISAIEAKTKENEASIKSQAQVITGQGTNLAAVEKKANANEASLLMQAQTIGEHSESISAIEQRTTDAEASIKSQTQLITKQGKSITAIEQKSNEHESAIISQAQKITAQGKSLTAVEQLANENKAAIELQAEKTDANTKNLASVQIQANKNSSQISQQASTIGKHTSNIADITTRTTANESSIKSQSQTITAQGKSIAAVESRTTATESSIKQQTQLINGNQKKIASVETTVNEQGSKIGLVVETSNGKNTVRGGMIIQAINGETSARISADRLDIEGKTLNIKVLATNIKGALTVGQIPDTVAQKSDILTKTSQLTNDSGFKNESGITSIVKGTVTTDYVNALGITARKATISESLTVKDGAGSTLFSAGGSAVKLGGWGVDNNSLGAGRGVGQEESIYLCSTGTNGAANIGGISQNGWCIIVGSKFGVHKSGAVYSTSGKIGGFSINNYALQSSDTKVGMCATSGNGPWAFWAGEGDYGAKPFRVGHAGELIATKANITGHIEATSGSIGGVLIGNLATTQNVADAKSDAVADAVVQIDNRGYQTKTQVTQITENTIKTTNVEAQNLVVQAAKIKGKLTASQIDATSLKVNAANVTGQLTASQINADGLSAKNVRISGYIDATLGGKIGGFKIDANTIDATDTRVGMCSIANIGKWAIWAGEGQYHLKPFRVGHGGEFVATKAEITGKVTAQSGTIGGWTLGEATLPNGTKTQAMYSGVRDLGSIGYLDYVAKAETWLTVDGAVVRYRTYDSAGKQYANNVFSKSWYDIIRA